MNTTESKEAVVQSPMQTASTAIRTKTSGQTLIIALIVLGLLLILGFVFLGIVDGNIKGGAGAKVRSQSNDLANAGIRLAQQQLVNSPAGADWRGTPTILSPIATSGTDATTGIANVNLTKDPDALYLRGAAFDSSGNSLNFPGTTLQDLGGPDGLGPFIRVGYDQGRALVRVRYGPSDANIFSVTPTGPLLFPGKVHNYLIIESIGREGVINTNDPTTFTVTNPANGQTAAGVQFQSYANQAALQTALSAMKQADSLIVNSRYLRAFATTGLLDNAHFITNKFNVTRPADVGFPNPFVTGSGGTGMQEYLPGMGVGFGTPVTLANGATAPNDLGNQLTYTLGTTASVPLGSGAGTAVPGGFGSFMSNADVTFHGNLQFNINDLFGDGIRVAGNINADDNASLTINDQSYAAKTATWTADSLGLKPDQITTRSSNFNTDGGLFLDGYSGVDLNGVPRGVGRLVPPSILQTDPQTGVNRYLALTKDTVGSAGAAGHGNGVYVSNTKDIQEPTDEAGRASTGSTESAMYDMMNPNNGSPTTGWRGNFYSPVAATLTLRTDGFVITRDDGDWPNLSTNTLRYRIGRYNGQLSIVDSSQDTTSINSSGPANYSVGQAFNGVLYFEGNVRVRGQIPTDAQLTVVSGGNLYIDGSITKGILGNDITDSYSPGNPNYFAYGAALGRPSKSALMLMARDNVAVNTTQFVGLQNNQSVSELNDQQNSSGFSPVVMSETSTGTPGELDLVTELNLDPLKNGAANPIPSNQVPFVTEYADSITGTPINTKLLLTHSMAEGSGAAAIFGMNINPGFGGTDATGSSTPNNPASYFYFPGSPGLYVYPSNPNVYPLIDNTATSYLVQNGLLTTPSTSIPQYGLGADSWQQFGKFESRGFDIVNLSTPAVAAKFNFSTGSTSPSDFTPAGGLITSANGNQDPFINYTLLAPATNDFQLNASSISGVPSNDYLLARAAVVPGDVVIEASVFAEEGSFLIIPGPWFNPNPNDTRAAFTQSITTSLAAANLARLNSYGNAPEVPFYGEPLDVRVQVIGSVSENMPPPLSVQSNEYSKWGWIPVSSGAPIDASAANGGQASIPTQHNPGGLTSVVPNFVISYDPVVATGRYGGFVTDNSTTTYIRTDSYGRPLLPMPRLPVSPAFTFFGDMQ
jgi:hypothetical protein